MDRLEVAPAFFTWDYENHPDHAAYVWTKKVDPPTYKRPLFMDFALTFDGLIE